MKNNNYNLYEYIRLLGFISLTYSAVCKYANANEVKENNIEINQLKEVIVTAEKRESHIQQTPISISAFSSEDIDELNIESFSDLGLRVPSLTLGNTSNFSTPDIYLRGVGTRDFTIGADLSIGFYVDDVYIGRAGNVFVDFFDLERIEILKGPQGTLWGRNAVAGAIHVISEKPSNKFKSKNQVTYGNFDLFRLAGSISGPLVKNNLLGKFSYSVRNHDGYSKNSFDGKDLGGAESINARTLLQYIPNNNTDIIIGLDYGKDRPTGIAFDSKIVSAPASGLGHIEPDGAFNVNVNTPGREHRDYYGISGNITSESSAVLFKSISSLRSYKQNLIDDTDGTSLTLARIPNVIDQTQFTQELRISNKPNNKLKWLLGAYFFHEEIENEFTIDSSDLGAFDLISTNFSALTTNSYSLFGQASYLLTKRINFTFGTRYTYEEKDFNIRRSGNALDGDFPLTRFNNDWQAFTPKVGIDFQQTTDILWYASISRGFRSGGFNALQSVLQPGFDPEFLLAYEIGLKSSWLKKRLLANLAAFYYDHSDLQVSTVGSSLAGGLTLITDNAAEAREMGFEAEFIAYPYQGLDISLGLAYLDTEYINFTSGTNDLSGNVINHSPTFRSSLNIQYTFPIAELGFITIGGEHQYQSEIFFTETNDAILSQGQYHNINARLGFETFDEQFGLNLFVNNLTNETTANAGVDLRSALGIVNHALNPPRTYGVEFTVQF